ncbi:MAG: type II secretion system protein [bacterium]|nr:type II secretion system protein [bacterium]
MKRDSGFTLIEVLVGIMLLSVMGLVIAQSLSLATKIQVKARNQALASQIAQDTLEEYVDSDFTAYIDGQTIADEVTRNGQNFKRDQNISFHGDGTRTVSVTVEAEKGALETIVSMSQRYRGSV